VTPYSKQQNKRGEGVCLDISSKYRYLHRMDRSYGVKIVNSRQEDDPIRVELAVKTHKARAQYSTRGRKNIEIEFTSLAPGVQK
jgi:hypothetical protein